MAFPSRSTGEQLWCPTKTAPSLEPHGRHAFYTRPLGLIRMKFINCILILLFSTYSLGQSESKVVANSPTKFVFKKTVTVSFPQTPETELFIEVKNDSIWRHTKQDGKIIGDYFMIEKNLGILNYYDKSKSVNYRKYDLFAKNDEYEIIEDRKDRKDISGFDCYKLIMVKQDTKSDLGNTIYEMYVTDEIDLPLHSVINLTKRVPNTFPMEISITEEKLPGQAERYELIRIE